MTKDFKVKFTCPNCGCIQPAETRFCQWMRGQPKLDSAHGFVRTDMDHIVLRYKTDYEGRGFQLMMIVEVKEYGAKPDDSQSDMLKFLHILASRKFKNVHGAKTVESLKIWSWMLGRSVRLRFYGVHLLQFEKTNPDDSTWIKWDHRKIEKEKLIDLLRMDRRPDNPDLTMDEFLRNRHKRMIVPEFDFDIDSKKTGT